MLKVVKDNLNDLESEENKIPFQSVSMDIWDKKYRLKSKKGDFIDNNIENIALYFDSKNSIPREIKALGLPATILIDQNGMQIAKYLGPADWEDQYFIDLFSKYIF